MNESSQFLALKQAGQVIKKPIPTLWANDRIAVLRGFALIAAGSIAFNTFFIFMPNHLAATGQLNLAAALFMSALALAPNGHSGRRPRSSF
jgi:MFS transporter, MHS family, proline/betaine transporter